MCCDQIQPGGAVAKDGRLCVGQRILEVGSCWLRAPSSCGWTFCCKLKKCLPSANKISSAVSFKQFKVKTILCSPARLPCTNTYYFISLWCRWMASHCWGPATRRQCGRCAVWGTSWPSWSVTALTLLSLRLTHHLLTRGCCPTRHCHCQCPVWTVMMRKHTSLGRCELSRRALGVCVWLSQKPYLILFMFH